MKQMINKKNRIKQNDNVVLKIICIAFVALYCASLLFVLFWVISSSLKHRFDLAENPAGLPQLKWGWQFSNYAKAFTLFRVPIIDGLLPRDVYLFEMFFNSLLYVIGCTVVTTLAHFFVAYACARYKFFLNKIIYTIVIIVMVVPIFGSLPAEIKMTKFLNMYDSIFGQFFLKANFLGMYFLVFYGLVKGIDKEYAEAAQIDGAGHFTVLFRIYMPMLLPSIVGIGVLFLIGFWQEYAVSLYYLPSHPLLAYGLYKIQFSTYTDITIPIQFAACIIATIPPIVLFICFRNKIMGNISMGGLKG